MSILVKLNGLGTSYGFPHISSADFTMYMSRCEPEHSTTHKCVPMNNFEHYTSTVNKVKR